MNEFNCIEQIDIRFQASFGGLDWKVLFLGQIVIFRANFSAPQQNAFPYAYAELYTTFPEERVLVATRFSVTFLPLRLCYKKTRTCFSKDAENLTTYGYVLWSVRLFVFVRMLWTL